MKSLPRRFAPLLACCLATWLMLSGPGRAQEPAEHQEVRQSLPDATFWLLESQRQEAAGDLAQALSAADRWLAATPTCSAHLRVAYLSARQGDLDTAEDHYRAALQLEPDSQEVALGLAWVEALRAARPGTEPWRASFSAGFQGYLDHASARALQSTTVTVTSQGLRPWSLWLGATGSLLERRGLESFRQGTTVLGGGLELGRFRLGAHAGLVLNDWARTSRRPLAGAQVSWQGPRLGADLSYEGAFYRGFSVQQLSAGLLLQGPARFRFFARGELALLRGRFLAADTATRTEWLGAAHAGVRWVASEVWALWASGYLGRRRYPIDDAGLSVFSSEDRFGGGGRLGTGLDLGRHWSLWAELRLDRGDWQAGAAGAFTLMGALVGAAGRW